MSSSSTSPWFLGVLIAECLTTHTPHVVLLHFALVPGSAHCRVPHNHTGTLRLLFLFLLFFLGVFLLLLLPHPVSPLQLSEDIDIKVDQHAECHVACEEAQPSEN